MKPCTALLGFLLIPAGINAQRVKLEPDQKYLLLATKQTSTMQKELDEVSAQGFRILMGSPTSGTEMALLLERVAAPPETYKYKLLATTNTGTMQRELNAAAGEGYRLLPRTLIAKNQAFIGPEIISILERDPKQEKKYEYRLLATTLTSTLQREMLQAIADGFQLAGMVSRGEHMVIMERETSLKPGKN